MKCLNQSRPVIIEYITTRLNNTTYSACDMEISLRLKYGQTSLLKYGDMSLIMAMSSLIVEKTFS